jgi:photosystem II stability/assembly factor-like uncharacterized protein
MSRTSALVLACVIAAASAAGARQTGQAPAAKPGAQSDQGAKPVAPSLSDQFPGLEFRNIGPFRGGRVTAVAGLRDEPLVYYFGATGGGLWKTTDGGATWKPLADKFLKTASVGAVAIAESDRNVIFAGMGQAPIRGNTSHGDGVYKSTDAGATWTNVGLQDTQQISRVRIHPANPDIVYAAAQGHVWGPNEDRGVYRTLDGGKTWKKVLFVDDKTGASDLVMDPTNPRILYAAFWQVHRKPWSLENGGPGGGLWKSIDAGDTWKKLTTGLPEGTVGKCTVSVSASRPSRIWAMVQHAEKGGLYRSDDGGEKWTLVNGSHRITQRGWYYSRLYADPRSADTVYVTNINFLRSIDGGKTFSRIRVRHGDTHDLWIDPDDAQRMILGDDGGAEVTFNGGQTWTTQDNQPTAEIYRVIADDRFPFWVYGGQQDNTTVAIPTGVRDEAITEKHWHDVGGGESAWVAPDPRNLDIVYAGSYGGAITRYDHKTGETRDIVAWPQVVDGLAQKHLKYRFQWNAPIILSAHQPGTLYHASQHLLRSRDEGQTWEEASPDLSRNDKAKQGYSGGPIQHEITGVETYGTIFYVVESPHEAGTLWAGTDDGLVHITRNNGASWENVTPKGMPEWIRINAIDVSPHDNATAYVAATMYQFDDYRPYLYKTSDYGKTWTKIVNGIPDRAFTRVVREDPGRRGLLFAGTESGLFISFDDGANWAPFQRNLPVVPITDITIKREDLVLATQGRAFWVLDDLTPLRQWKPEIASQALHLFEPRAAHRMPGSVSERPDAGKNRPNGLITNFWLKEKPKADVPVMLEFLEGDTVVRALSSVEKKAEPDELAEPGDEGDDEDEEKAIEPAAGVNRVVWNLRQSVPTLVRPRYTYGDFPPQGIRITPGKYRVRLKVGAETREVPFEVQSNPALKVPAEDLRAQADFLHAVRDDLLTLNAAVRRIKDVKVQLAGLQKRADAIGKGEALKPKTEALTKKLSDIADGLYNPNLKTSQDSLNFLPKLDFQLSGVGGMSDGAEAKPTAAALARHKELQGQLTEILARLDVALTQDLGALNKAVADASIPPVIAVPFEKKR